MGIILGDIFMGDDLSLKLGEKAISDYNKRGKEILAECQNILKRANVPIPIVADNNKENVAGLQVEHIDENTISEDENTKSEDENIRPEEDKEDVKESNKESETSFDISNSVKEGKFSGNNSTINSTYSKIVSRENKIKNSGSSSKSVVSVQNFTDAMDDIEAAGKQHIAALDDQLPESGNVSGGFTSSYQKSTGVNSYSFQANVTNAWQNKKKNFGIVASASIGHDEKKVNGDIYDADDYFDDDDDADTNNTDNDKSSTASTGSTSDSENNSAVPEESLNEASSSKFGSISVNMRLKKENFTYGGGIVSTFSTEKTQVHDQFITVKHNDTGSLLDGVSADLTRRTYVSFDDETGERYSRSEMKLTVDLVNRGKDEDIVDEPEPDTPSETEPANLVENESRTEAEEDAKKHKIKDGSGLDIDFKYDSTVCGAEFQYGINVVNDAKKKVRFTVAPVGGAFDYSASDSEPEAFKASLGIASEFKKRWKDGSSLDASLYAIANRVVQNGSSPNDLCYVIANGQYSNPRKKLNVNVDAGIIKNQVSTAYIEASASKQMKNFDIAVQAGLSKTKAGDVVDNSFQVLVSGKYNIPYKTKK